MEAATIGGAEFIGNVEGRDLMTDGVDVIVTDGFTGNVVLKTAEGELRGREVVFDQQTKRLKAIGRWKMTLNPKTIAKMLEGSQKQGEMRTGTR